MSDTDEQGRTEPPLLSGQEDQLLGFLDYQRQTLEWKCSRLGADALRMTTSASTLTLGGLLKHMAFVENHWFARRLSGLPAEPPWDAVDWTRDPDWEWHSAAQDTPEQLFALWRNAVDTSRKLTAEALADGGFDRLADIPWSDGRVPNLRWIVLHMIEEYARHNGHADLLRECIDGQTGE